MKWTLWPTDSHNFIGHGLNISALIVAGNCFPAVLEPRTEFSDAWFHGDTINDHRRPFLEIYCERYQGETDQTINAEEVNQ